ncbi:LytTR family DNA-binding domain-containing protein [Marinovum sp.]|uniref:LytTR family DNA-binding domain-containing protein n=1 Tax=Marinovum sp. TaxID=2024839 RepID=UPI002B2737AF|nr:LytTR family DNA-binding domain-containing protein [Marinovum sp.]
MRETLADIWGSIGWERKILGFFGGVLVLAVTGPFGTYEVMSFAQRLVFWLVVFTGVGFFMHVCQTTALKTAWLGPLPPVLRLAVGALLAGLPGAAVVIFVHGVFRPPVVAGAALPVIWLQVALIGWVVGIVEFLDWGGKGTSREPPQRRTGFHKRLPPELGDDIISISMQDHYAEVTTTLGSHLVLIRLSDAMAELKGAAGLQLHRSHYASIAHLVRLHREGTRLKATLSDGRELPVSASHADAVRAALKAKSEKS